MVTATATARADATDDARYIVSQTVTDEVLSGAWVAMRPVLVSAISNDLNQNGIKVDDMDAYFDIFDDEFTDEFLGAMQRESVTVQLELFSPTELHDIASFYRSPSGQALIRQTPRMMEAGAKIGETAGRVAGANAGPRVAQRLKTEGVRVTTDESVLERLINMLTR
jgi:hypothetical protein